MLVVKAAAKVGLVKVELEPGIKAAEVVRIVVVHRQVAIEVLVESKIEVERADRVALRRVRDAVSSTEFDRHVVVVALVGTLDPALRAVSTRTSEGVQFFVREQLKVGVEREFVVKVEAEVVVIAVAVRTRVQVVFVERDVAGVGGRVFRGPFALVLLLGGGEMLFQRPDQRG